MSNEEILVRCKRGKIVESIHFGHIAVSNSQGTLLFQCGNPHYFTYARSTAKPLQAIALIESGAERLFQLNDRDIAVICASHNGEIEHTEAVISILDKIGLTPSYLRCGVHEPFYRPAAQALLKNGCEPNVLHNNCSGKHTGMLALCKLLGADLHNYELPTHPVQQLMLATVAAMCGIKTEHIITAVDGCGVPVFGLPLSHLALGLATLGTPSVNSADTHANACRRIVSAFRAQPYYLAGTDRFDTDLITVTNGRIIGKMGAEGVYALTVPDSNLGMAVKITDGASRALYPSVVEVLQQLDLLNNNELQSLQSYHKPLLTNRRGDPVGFIEPGFQLLPL